MSGHIEAQGGYSSDPQIILTGKSLRNLLPEGGFLRGEEGVLAGVPAEEMRGARVGGMVVTSGPDFVKEKRAGLIGAAVQVVLQAAFFLARGIDEGA